MSGPAPWILLAAGAIAALGLAYFSLVSFREGERRAARVALIFAVVTAASFCFLAVLPPPIPLVATGFFVVLAVFLVVAWFLPLRGVPTANGKPDKRVDERDIMFARGRLVPGSPEYESYYSMRPENHRSDDHTRSLPGLLSSHSEAADPIVFAAAEASFDLTEAVRDHVDGPVADLRIERTPEAWTRILKDYARSYGAVDAGVTELQPYHVYTNVGRGTGVYGERVRLEHRWALAFTVEMDYQMISSAPYPPTTMESGRQYVEFARVAVQLAAAIRSLGFPARAHIDGNYRVIAPLVARDAGLGEIGRMGLLMTSRQGPRVRVGVVTTDLTLIADSYQADGSLIDFCNICQKCADNCPSQSIPHGNREVNNGVLRWKIIPESCYHYWTIIGTDCGRCLAVCPYSHPDNWAHNLVRWGISKSGTFRRAALVLDDFLYGKKPVSGPKSVFPSGSIKQQQ